MCDPTILFYFRSGELTLISGHTGKGKTTWLSDYSIDLGLAGVKTLWGSFELRVERLQSIQVRILILIGPQSS